MNRSLRNWPLLALAAALCAVDAFAAATPDTTAWHVDDAYHAKCAYRCCDTKRNCSADSFYMGGRSGFPTSCDWKTVCSHEGTVGWSYGGTPSQNNSTLSVQQGCWTNWRNYWGEKTQVLPCGQKPKPDLPPAPPAPPPAPPAFKPLPATPQQVRQLLEQLDGLKKQIDVMPVDHIQLQEQWGALQATVQKDDLPNDALQAKFDAFQKTVYQAIKNEPDIHQDISPHRHVR